MNTSALSAWAPRVLSILRIVAGLLLLQHGTQKILHFPLPADGSGGGIDLSTLAGWSGPIELVGGILMILGLFTRGTGFILAGFTAVAYWMVHAPKSPYPIENGGNGGELAVLYCFVFFYIIFAGPGAWAVDNLRGRKRA